MRKVKIIIDASFNDEATLFDINLYVERRLTWQETPPGNAVKSLIVRSVETVRKDK